MSILTVESQSRFPLEDISSTSADKLELILQNQSMVEKGQQVACSASFLYRVGSKAIEIAIKNLFEEDKAAALTDGIKTYEAVSSMVRPIIDNSVHNTIDAHRDIIQMHNDLITNPVDTMIEVSDIFISCLPHTSAAVSERANRFNPFTKDYVIIGAALVYELESRRIEAVTLQ
jgi:hypothetical protein